uniref:Uncharacterized protein n=1 Tax=Chromera velia CCMP2878 TaxID=1169474 RepID=A0A0G4H2P1_9ALVE|eukprot:Cvel_24463.t1-p1 / transcript=Cvel_24463.t1 / gene=Cvel_24463 / organism=Chromera_velia_CCMP2878 / gene_product=hypothetical protein / transcript_product=hypothetical protein / location=Cvel_scaffold2646:19095-22215(-) / protein_length=693 / sequence_SO=supercontig / SO=protein_coding / is_pseudo=false
MKVVTETSVALLEGKEPSREAREQVSSLSNSQVVTEEIRQTGQRDSRWILDCLDSAVEDVDLLRELNEEIFGVTPSDLPRAPEEKSELASALDGGEGSVRVVSGPKRPFSMNVPSTPCRGPRSSTDSRPLGLCDFIGALKEASKERRVVEALDCAANTDDFCAELEQEIESVSKTPTDAKEKRTVNPADLAPAVQGGERGVLREWEDIGLLQQPGGGRSRTHAQTKANPAPSEEHTEISSVLSEEQNSHPLPHVITNVTCAGGMLSHVHASVLEFGNRACQNFEDSSKVAGLWSRETQPAVPSLDEPTNSTPSRNRGLSHAPVEVIQPLGDEAVSAFGGAEEDDDPPPASTLGPSPLSPPVQGERRRAGSASVDVAPPSNSVPTGAVQSQTQTGRHVPAEANRLTLLGRPHRMRGDVTDVCAGDEREVLKEDAERESCGVEREEGACNEERRAKRGSTKEREGEGVQLFFKTPERKGRPPSLTEMSTCNSSRLSRQPRVSPSVSPPLFASRSLVTHGGASIPQLTKICDDSCECSSSSSSVDVGVSSTPVRVLLRGRTFGCSEREGNGPPPSAQGPASTASTQGPASKAPKRSRASEQQEVRGKEKEKVEEKKGNLEGKAAPPPSRWQRFQRWGGGAVKSLQEWGGGAVQSLQEWGGAATESVSHLVATVRGTPGRGVPGTCMHREERAAVKG